MYDIAYANHNYIRNLWMHHYYTRNLCLSDQHIRYLCRFEMKVSHAAYDIARIKSLDEVVTTWVGKDNNKSAELTGSSGALVLFSGYMKEKIGK